jgi:uncharacterized membrane protein
VTSLTRAEVQAPPAPVGLLMAVLGYVVGTYGALAVAWLLGQLAT